MRIVSLALIVLGFSGHARRVKVTDQSQSAEASGPQGSSSVSELLARSLLASNPAAGWQPVSGAIGTQPRLNTGRHQTAEWHRSLRAPVQEVSMLAKKKGGPKGAAAAAAAAALANLDALEAAAPPREEVAPAPKKKKKVKKATSAKAAALAALDAMEAEEPATEEAEPVKKTAKKAKNAKAAALAALEAMEAQEPVTEEAEPVKKKAKKAALEATEVKEPALVGASDAAGDNAVVMPNEMKSKKIQQVKEEEEEDILQVEELVPKNGKKNGKKNGESSKVVEEEAEDIMSFIHGDDDDEAPEAAGKKNGKHVDEEDMMSFINGDDDEEADELEEKLQQKKKGKKKKPALDPRDFLLDDLHDFADDSLGQVIPEDEDGDLSDFLDTQKRMSKNFDDAAAEAGLDEEQEEVEPTEPLEARMRREKPKAKLRITESTQPGQVSLSMDKISLYIGNQEILKDATWTVKTGEKVGLVGANGAGKSTQLRILAGDIEPTSGEIIKSSKRLKVTFLKQEFIDDIVMNRTLRDEFMSVFGEGVGVLRDLAAAETELALPETTEDPERMQNILDKMAELQAEAERLGAYEMDSKVDRVLDQMGFAPGEHNALVGSFSGGWKMRIGMGKILLQDPNILLLDEPTNHLDLETVEWLEGFLQDQKLPMVIVSHDREFLDRTCNKIVETLEGVSYTYNGDYTSFLEQKDERLAIWRATYESQQKKIKEERTWIRKAKGKEDLVERVRSRQMELDKFLASKDIVEEPPNKEVRFKFRFPQVERRKLIGDSLVTLKDVSHGYHNRNLFSDFSMSAYEQDRIAFLGPNGAGKSTLFRLILGAEEPNSGVAKMNPDAEYTFYAQSQADELDLEDTVIGVISKAAPIDYGDQETRALCAKFLFRGDNVFKKIKGLSGGEKARVALARMMLTPSSMLIMDEPTNHLDIPAKEMLEEALQHYDGTLLLISHDRYFLSKVATKIYALEDKSFKMYDGDYRYYLSFQPGYQDKLDARYVEGVSREIESPVIVEQEDKSKKKKKKNFGGSGVKMDKAEKRRERQREKRRR